MIQQKFVDVYLKRPVAMPVVPFVQYESGWELVLTYKDVTIPSGATAQIFAKKPSGLCVYNNGTVDRVNGIVTVPITNQTLAEDGRVLAQVQIQKNDEMISTFTVALDVKASVAEDAEESHNESDIFHMAADVATQTAAEAIEQAIGDSATLQQKIVDTLENHPEWATTIQDNAVSTPKIANRAVTTPKLADGSVTLAKLNSEITDFDQASTRTNIANGDSIPTIFGKIRKWFADLGTAAFRGVANNLTTAASGTSVLDAYQGKLLSDATASMAFTTGVRGRIAAGDDLDDYTSPGTYTCGGAEIAGTLSNCPVSSIGFKLFVMYSGYGTTAYALQILMTGSSISSGTGAQTYIRTHGGASEGWDSWERISTNRRTTTTIPVALYDGGDTTPLAAGTITKVSTRELTTLVLTLSCPNVTISDYASIRPTASGGTTGITGTIYVPGVLRVTGAKFAAVALQWSESGIIVRGEYDGISTNPQFTTDANGNISARMFYR